ncbi:hypothetical protein [Methylorubrum thiocyanatum]|uniref:hypothetical protein n=1 Tax=Methylorubrum thiocyanatum TaxID=47958 RepID=UPI003F7FC67F
MPTTIRLNIANGYRPQVDAYVEAHPALSRDEAARRWVEERYGAWITANITECFELSGVSMQQFDVTFPEEADAVAFKAAIGGREVREEGGAA